MYACIGKRRSGWDRLNCSPVHSIHCMTAGTGCHTKNGNKNYSLSVRIIVFSTNVCVCARAPVCHFIEIQFHVLTKKVKCFISECVFGVIDFVYVRLFRETLYICNEIGNIMRRSWFQLHIYFSVCLAPLHTQAHKINTIKSTVNYNLFAHYTRGSHGIRPLVGEHLLYYIIILHQNTHGKCRHCIKCVIWLLFPARYTMFHLLTVVIAQRCRKCLFRLLSLDVGVYVIIYSVSMISVESFLLVSFRLIPFALLLYYYSFILSR